MQAKQILQRLIDNADRIDLSTCAELEDAIDMLHEVIRLYVDPSDVETRHHNLVVSIVTAYD